MQPSKDKESEKPLSPSISPMDGVTSDSSRVIANQDEERGRWALGIGDVGVQGSKAGRGVDSNPNDYAISAVQTSANRMQAASLSAANQTIGSSSSTAATLLMAASTLAQTPAQSVSNALLGHVQMVAAAEQQSRRSSLASTSEFPQDNGEGKSIETASSDNNRTAFKLGVLEATKMPPLNQLATMPPQSPRSAATFQVGSIATNAAAYEYLEQVSFLSRAGDSNSSTDLHYKQAPIEQDSRNVFGPKRWDANNPFQGVPSLPLTPSASLAMLPPSNLMTRGMTTPLTPENANRDYYFQPTYRLAPDEYAILASAAAVATVALTTASSDGNNANDSESTSSLSLGGEQDTTFAGSQGRSSRPLNPEEQEEIASLLRAWAGLEGDERQSEARKKLQQRQSELNQIHHEAQTQFFPPDFARHYQSQLTALAAGYYEKLHSDGLADSNNATSTIEERGGQFQRLPPSAASSQKPQSSGSMTTASLLANTGTSSAEFQTLQRNAMDARREAKAEAGMQQIHTDSNELNDNRERLLVRQQRLQQQHDQNHQKLLNSFQQQPQRKEPTAVDPMQLISNASRAAGLEVTSPQVRDQLLQYAHNLYSTGSTTTAPATKTEENKTGEEQKPGQAAKSTTKIHPTLLPLLHTLHNLHPNDLPTLLLLSCVYYSSGDLQASLWYNKTILRIDPNYVESMSNIGTTLRALGRWREAEGWWWRAIKLRPGYWDAYENLLGVLCSPQQTPPGQPGDTRSSENDQNAPQVTGPRFREALKLCDFVENHVLAKKDGEREERRIRKVPGGGEHPICMPSHLPLGQAPRLQNLLYAKGNLKYVVPDSGVVPAAKEYQKAVEMMLSSSEQSAYSMRDLIVATYVVGILTFGVMIPGAAGSNAAREVAQALGLDPNNLQHAQLAASAQYSSLSSGGVMRLVRDSGDSIVTTLLRLGGGNLPMLLLLPESMTKLTKVLFAESDGALPAIVSSAHSQRSSTNTFNNQQSLQQASSMTSTILLTLSKLFQDSIGTVVGGPHGPLTLGGIPASTSSLLPFYYLSLSLHPSASTANNLGILLSSIPAVASVLNGSGQRQAMNGQTLALQYYTYGLQLDAKHPHLYTNFGSLLKDLNHLTEAIKMYEKAIECNPDFDVALANLGNAIKDQGRTQDSVQYYRRAVKVNPNFPEALCGLVNALLAVCDWKEVYEEDDEGKASGFMKRVRELLEKQIEDGTLYGARALSMEGRIEDWVELVMKSTGDHRPEHRQYLSEKFAFFYNDKLNRKDLKINEGSFIIRLIERLLRRSQRRWYLDEFVTGTHTNLIEPKATDVQKYPRIPLPSCLVTPVVPTVLPFHTFTLKISTRHIRLISHRNALRISQTTLSQLWLPPHVYPPPPPPRPKIKVGYISSDFNNHPLAHLMQSVFGFHNLNEFEIHLYATTESDKSPYRIKIEKEAEHFTDVSTWSNQDLIKKILEDGIHILMNLNGYTKGARNEVFAARPCPVQMEFMGFAGGLASGWTDWIVVDPIVCPPEVTSTDYWRKDLKSSLPGRATDWKGDLDPEAETNDWIYTEKFIYMPDSYFVNDHRQGFREPTEREAVDGGGTIRPHEMGEEEAWQEEEERRWKARKEMWPSLPDDYIIFSDFNQLYKLEPTLFKLWLRILKRVPNSILWLLRFPAAGEAHLLEYAREKFGPQVASRVIFTEVAPKGVHIHRGRIADLFLDTLECGAHTTSADILWSATPVLTWPKHKHKMASRVAASIVQATGLGEKMIVDSEQAYEDRAVELANGLKYRYLDADGTPLQPLVNKEGYIQADALQINQDCNSAMPHGQSTNSAATNDTSQSMEKEEESKDPAPANVEMAAAVSEASNSVVSPHSKVLLPSTGEQAPKETVTRRGLGELTDLRKALFLTRDSNRLFDTKRWVINLEKGYKEAWSRFVDGTDTEESMEWEALSDEDERKKSGHIWIRD